MIKISINNILHKKYGNTTVDFSKSIKCKIDLKYKKISSNELKSFEYDKLIKTKDDNNKIYFKVTNCPIYENKAITINFYNKIKLWFFNFKIKNVFITLYNFFKHSLN